MAVAGVLMIPLLSWLVGAAVRVPVSARAPPPSMVASSKATKADTVSAFVRISPANKRCLAAARCTALTPPVLARAG